MAAASPSTSDDVRAEHAICFARPVQKGDAITVTTFDLEKMDQAARYRLLTASIVPRPIAWIVTVDAHGRVNVAPFSCFNLMGYDPPIVAIGIQTRADGGVKDTYRNILETGELTVNLVAAGDTARMFATAAEVSADVDEAALVGLELEASSRVAPPRIASAPVSFECRLHDRLATNDAQAVVVARIVAAHYQRGIVRDAERGHVDTAAMELIGRMEGPGWYVRCTDRFRHPAPPIETGEG